MIIGRMGGTPRPSTASASARVALPEGTVTFLFSDIEGSTQLLERFPDRMGDALAVHHELFERIVAKHRGAIFETVGDAVYAAFARASDAVASALDLQRALSAEDWGSVGRVAVRIAVHTGEVERRGTHYYGPALFRTARIQSLAWGEQTLLSEATARLVSDALPDGATLRDRGLHRLKDLGEPERVHQLVHPDVRDKFPPLKSLDARRHNLPIVASSFIGRDAELREVSALLGSHRLVTLTGPGGSGKTRLALQAAANAMPAFADGVTFVDLASVLDVEHAMGAIGAALGLRQRADEPIDATILAHLADQELLLVLDNLEQIRPHPGPQVATLVAAAPRTRVLATSRGPLRVRGEQEFPVGKLDAAATLFRGRAAEVRPDLAVRDEDAALVDEVCAALDGLPLAIELAAARMRMFDLPELRDRLTSGEGGRLRLLTEAGTDAPERQRTMREAIAWSVDLLSPTQRTAFGRLSVFAGAFEPAAGETVISDVGDDPLAILDALVHQALLVPIQHAQGRRVRMLEPIREYAAEVLASSGEIDAARAAHARWVISLTEAAAAAHRGPQIGVAFDRVASYIDDVRGALGWAFEGGDADIGIRIAIAMGPYWDGRDASEGVTWLERAVGLPALEPATRLQLIRPLGWVHRRRGDHAAAQSEFTELVRLGRLLGERDSVASGLSNLADIALFDGRLADARRHLDELDRAGGEESGWALAIFQRMRGQLEAGLGNVEPSEEHFRRSEEAARASGDPSNVAATLHDRGVAAIWSGDLEVANGHLAEAERLAREVGFMGTLGPALAHLTVVAARRRNVESARAAAGEALQVYESLGGVEYLEELLGVAAWIAVESGRVEAAATLVGAASARWDRIEPGARPSDRAWHADLADRAREAAGKAWPEAYARGRQMLVTEALRLARSAVVP